MSFLVRAIVSILHKWINGCMGNVLDEYIYVCVCVCLVVPQIRLNIPLQFQGYTVWSCDMSIDDMIHAYSPQCIFQCNYIMGCQTCIYFHEYIVYTDGIVHVYISLFFLWYINLYKMPLMVYILHGIYIDTLYPCS